jgi:transcriptional regulator GlxA family with amidase domain
MRFGIFIYDGVEPIDLATFGVLSMARRIALEIEICTIAPKAGPVALANGLKLSADFGFDNAPSCDLVIVTGGASWPVQAQSRETLDFIRRVHASGRIASVCTGGMILAASGVLDGGAATTKREVVPPEKSPLEVMRAGYPAIDVRRYRDRRRGFALHRHHALSAGRNARPARRRRDRADHGISACVARQSRRICAGPAGVLN